MTQFINFLFLALGLGAVYALLAIPLSVVFSTTGVIDVAVGVYATVAGLTAASVGLPLGLVAGAGAGMACAGVVGGLYLLIGSRPKADVILLILVGLLVLLIGTSVGQAVFGVDPRSLGGLRSAFTPGQLIIPHFVLAAAAVTAVMLLAVLALLHKTRIGEEMRAVASNPQAAGLCGINVRRYQFAAFVAGGLLASAAGILLGVSRSVAYNSSLVLTLLGFGALIVLGIRGPARAVAGGLAIALIEVLSVGYLPAGIATAMPLVFILVVLASGRFDIHASSRP